MILTFIFVIFFSATIAKSEKGNHLNSEPDKSYMNFFLGSYFNWHEKNFHFRPSFENVEANKFLQKAIAEIDHWKTPENNQLDQLLLGQGFFGNQPYYVFRVYIAKHLNNDLFLRQSGVKGRILFIETLPNKRICLITEGKENWLTVPVIKDGYYLKYFCKSNNQKNFLLSYVAVLSIKQKNIIVNPFPVGTENELSIYSKKGIESSLYYSKTTDYSILPRKHYSYIHLTAKETLLNFDKYSVDTNGSIIIYHP